MVSVGICYAIAARTVHVAVLCALRQNLAAHNIDERETPLVRRLITDVDLPLTSTVEKVRHESGGM